MLTFSSTKNKPPAAILTQISLVCKRINFALEPQILSEITLCSPMDLASRVESLVTTEPKPTSASKYATKLSIGPLCTSSDQNEVTEEEAKIKSFLVPAISSLVGVRQILWYVGQYDAEWATLLVLDALASLPVLEDLHLNVWSPPDSPVPFQRLSNLKNFTLTSDFSNHVAVISTVAGLIGRNQPELTSLTIVDDGYHADGAPTLQDFLAETSSSVCLRITHLKLSGIIAKFDASALRHLRSLISLTIVDIFSPYDETTEYRGADFLAQKIWSTLQSEKIYLQELVTDDAQPALVEYLTSFSGLRHLRLISTSSHFTPPWVSNQLAIRYYEQGLENHISFLESLEVRSTYEGKWCFGNHCSNLIKKGTRLTLLELSINSRDIPGGEEEIRHYAESPTRQNAIWSLLDICATLPVLRSLTIRSAYPEYTRGDRFGSEATMHRARMRVWIAQNLESYGPITPNHVFDVSALGTKYAGTEPLHQLKKKLSHNASLLTGREENLVKKLCVSRRFCDSDVLSVSRIEAGAFMTSQTLSDETHTAWYRTNIKIFQNVES
ncbi:uncharacterized protein LACBIDRAFT_295356 [Laccaria bicolor S238N-H82]|uniref:Predicted protein n=1 Tax=Laccaria bicolor (strain S238N-H82 / ATCC MYA-4686) TaxID=486041 RepID=B0DRA0_LACBS|nr:uncharacterized protein LACBIDRAFT_295356 [Laccaria bicolor S238N-H82]EDR02835.1 predicted protein [Laccaria bicolor S238N-H82]|eukprot:XP_001886545.1 predicted protein [Laccaria bicolor S238N-H82]